MTYRKNRKTGGVFRVPFPSKTTQSPVENLVAGASLPHPFAIAIKLANTDWDRAASLLQSKEETMNQVIRAKTLLAVCGSMTVRLRLKGT